MPRFYGLSVAVHLLHADAGDRRQSGADVLRLGRRRPRLLSADRFLVRQASANAAAIKAFIVNRVGDFGFALGIFAVFMLFGSRQFRRRLRRGAGAWPARPSTSSAMDCRCADHRLPAAVRRRHGQVGAARPAHLAARRDGRPDAGLGPDPCRDHGDGGRVHGRAAVAAVRICADGARRSSPSSARTTAIFAATVGLVQNDIKRVIAYSTCSQLGYMFFACGVSAYSAGDVPSDDPRLLQGAAVPRRRLGDPRHVAASRTCARWAGSGPRSRSPMR